MVASLVYKHYLFLTSNQCLTVAVRQQDTIPMILNSPDHSDVTVESYSQHNETLNTLIVTCYSSYQLIRDCSNFSGATYSLTIAGLRYI